jgi:hypothetical protein
MLAELIQPGVGGGAVPLGGCYFWGGTPTADKDCILGGSPTKPKPPQQ